MSRRGGGLYSNFVPLNDSENRPYRGAEIPPPTNLQGQQGNSNRNYGGVPPPANFHGNSSGGSGVNRQGYSTINSISAGMPGNFQPEKEINVRKARTEDDYFNEADDEDYQIGSKKPKSDDFDLPYQPAPGSPSYVEAKKEESSDSEEDPLDAFMANLEKDAKSKGVKAAGKFKIIIIRISIFFVERSG